MKDGQGKQDENPVGKPRVKSEQVQTLWNMVGVEQLEDIKVEQVQAVAAFADQ